MKTNKAYKILLWFVILILFLYCLSLANVKIPNSKNKIINEGENIGGLAIPVAEGRLMVKNFFKEALKSGKDALLLRQNKNFNILYFKADKSFLIVLNSEPLIQNGILAEKELLKILNITEMEACILKVNLTVPAEVNSQVSGKNYELSFCPNKQSLLNFEENLK